MRSKYLKKLISLVLTVVFYLLLLPLLIFFRDVLGLENEFVTNLLNILVFIIVYGFAAIILEIIFKQMNERLMILRKANGGRDIAAEERHEDDSTGLITLSINDNK